MISLKLIPTSFSRYLPARKAWSPRAFIAASPKLSKSEKDKETIEACENVKEAASAVKEGATAVKNTGKYVKDTASSTAKNVNKMTKEVSDKTKDLITAVAMETNEMHEVLYNLSCWNITCFTLNLVLPLTRLIINYFK